MAESQILSVIRVWAAVAWADGVLAEAEAEGLRRLIRTRRSDGRRAQRRARVPRRARSTCPTSYLTNLNPEARRGIYRAACRMAVVDHVFAHAERKLLDRLQTAARHSRSISPQEIEADVPGMESR